MPVKDKIAFFEGRQHSEQDTEDEDGFAVFPETNRDEFNRRDSLDEGTAERQGKKFLLPSMMRGPGNSGNLGAHHQRSAPASDIWGAFNDLPTNSRNMVALPGMMRLRPNANTNNHSSSFFSRHAQSVAASSTEQPTSIETMGLPNASSSRPALTDRLPATAFTSATAGLASSGSRRNHLEGLSGRTWGISTPAKFSYNSQTSTEQQRPPSASEHADLPSTLTMSKRRALEAAVSSAHGADFSQLPPDGLPSLHTNQNDNKDRKLLYAQRMRAGFMRSSGLGQFTPKRPG